MSRRGRKRTFSLTLRKTERQTAAMRSKADIELELAKEAANDCDFNRSMQHLISNYREEDVEYEVPNEDLFHRD